MIEFQCGACGERLKAADDRAGKKGRCKACGEPTIVPDVFPVQPSDPPTVRPSVPTQATTGLPLDLDPNRPSAPKHRDRPRRPASLLGAVSFALGSMSVVWAGTEGYHPPAWSVAQLALAFGVLSLFGTLGPRGTAAGWPLAGVVASLLGLGFCSGMEQRESRRAHQEAFIRRQIEAGDR